MNETHPRHVAPGHEGPQTWLVRLLEARFPVAQVSASLASVQASLSGLPAFVATDAAAAVCAAHMAGARSTEAAARWVRALGTGASQIWVNNRGPVVCLLDTAMRVPDAWVAPHAFAAVGALVDLLVLEHSRKEILRQRWTAHGDHENPYLVTETIAEELAARLLSVRKNLHPHLLAQAAMRCGSVASTGWESARHQAFDTKARLKTSLQELNIPFAALAGRLDIEKRALAGEFNRKADGNLDVYDDAPLAAALACVVLDLCDSIRDRSEVAACLLTAAQRGALELEQEAAEWARSRIFSAQ